MTHDGKGNCFACGRRLGANPAIVDTRDDQLAFVGTECYRKVVAAKEAGYQPPRGGPRLFQARGTIIKNGIACYAN